MARATWLADVLSDAGLVIHPFDGWLTRGGNDFEPVGLILHHTVTAKSSPDVQVDRMLAITGSSSTPPPLCNYSTNRDGSVSIIAAGTANHGGVGGWKGISGNRNWLGDEMKNRGTNALEPWPAVQLAAARIAAAAVLGHIRRDAGWMCGHKEYALPAGRKSDPHSLVMDSERARVAALMENGDEMPWPVIDKDSHIEAIRYLQQSLSVAFDLPLVETGVWDAPTTAAVAKHLGPTTGSPTVKAGENTNGRSMVALQIALSRAVDTGADDSASVEEVIAAIIRDLED